MENDKEMRLREKATFYYKEEAKCHVTKEPKGFVRGVFLSDLQEGGYYKFEDIRWPDKPTELFLNDIFDINRWRPNPDESSY